jgi:hypothetical protein
MEKQETESMYEKRTRRIMNSKEDHVKQKTMETKIEMHDTAKSLVKLDNRSKILAFTFLQGIRIGNFAHEIGVDLGSEKDVDIQYFLNM